MLAQSWVKLRQRQKTGDSRPTGFGGLTTPPKGCHSVKAPFVLGNVSTGERRLQQTTNNQTAWAWRCPPLAGPHGRQRQGDLRSPRAAWSPRRVLGLAGRPLRGGKNQTQTPLPQGRVDLPSQACSSKPEVSSSHLDRRSARPTSPPGSWPGLWRRPAGRTADSGEASSSAHCQGRREERATQLPTTPAPGTCPANVSPSAPTMASQHPRANPGPSGRDFSGETAAARVLSPQAERRPAKTDSHGRRGPKPVLS